MNWLSTSLLANLSARPIARQTGKWQVSVLWAGVLGILLVSQGCCPQSAGVGRASGGGFCDKVDHVCDCGKSPECGKESDKPKKGKSSGGFAATRFGGPYTCQEVRKKLNNFAAYEQVGLDFVQVCELTHDLLCKSIDANQKRAAKLRMREELKRFQRYNYVISNKGRLLVAVWTTDEKKLDDVQKRFGIKYISDVKGMMVDFGAEEPFDPSSEKVPTGTTAYIDVPGTKTAKRFGLLDASSNHFRIVQEDDADFDPERWMSRTVAYAGELIVDTTAKTAAGEPDAYFYLNNGSGTYRPDAHYLRSVARYVLKKVSVAPRFVQNPHGGKDGNGEVWPFRAGAESVICPPTTAP